MKILTTTLRHSNFFLVQLTDTTRLEKAKMMVLSKEPTDKDRSMKTQLLISSTASNDEKLSGENVWKNNGFFKDTKPELNLEKVNIPENCLFYVNQSFLSTVKNGEIAMYNQNFILGQIIFAANQPKEILKYECQPNEVKLLSCIYDLETGEFKGLRQQLAYIVLRGDENEIFLLYGYDKNKSKILYSFSKQQIPDAFISTSFKKHFNEILNEKRNEESSTLFFFLPSITDRKESINQWKNNPSLTPIDFNISFIENFSSQNEKFQPNLLNSSDIKKRDPQVEILYGVFKHMAQISNQNLQRNVTHLNLKQNRNTNEMEWSTSRFDSTKFKLTY